MSGLYIVVSSEHNGNYIPEEYKHLFENADEVVESHRGWDIGVEKIAFRVSKLLNAPLFQTQVSRLIVDCNRSDFRPDLFSEFTRDEPEHIRKEILHHYYYPYRTSVEEFIDNKIGDGKMVLHLSMHTFTPVFQGVERYADIGLLLDESKATEFELCKTWKTELERELPEKKIALNYPYGGAEDGFTSYMRRKHDCNNYMGVEVEVNQKYADIPELGRIKAALVNSLQNCLRVLYPENSALSTS